MEHGIVYDGCPSLEEIREANGWPAEERFALGPVAIVECVQQIPCNPCEASCPSGAISIGAPITRTPRVDPEKCVGCGKCVAACPGLAIFIVDKSRGEEALVSFPFEYLPLPQKDQEEYALNRAGEFVCTGREARVANPAGNDHTAVVTVAIPKEYGDEVRTIRREGAPAVPVSPAAAEGNRELPDDVIVCRCEEVTAGEIRRSIREYGATTVTEVKRRVRSGMGLCQGRTCGKLTMRILSEETGKPASELLPATSRPPVRPLTFGELAAGERFDEEASKGDGTHE